jgi:hypothetical protein
MSPVKWVRRFFRPRTESPEDEAAVGEEYGTSGEGREELDLMERASGGGPVPGAASSDAVATARGELSQLERPDDTAP